MPPTLQELVRECDWREEPSDWWHREPESKWGREHPSPICDHLHPRIPRVRSAESRDPWDRLPRALRSIRDSIEHSHSLLDLEFDWDEAGALPIDEPTWRRAASFLSRHALWVWDTYGTSIDPPDITPGPDASIDVHWDSAACEMLINIPADPNAMAGFYGDDRGNISIKGKFDPRHVNEGLLQWLTKSE